MISNRTLALLVFASVLGVATYATHETNLLIGIAVAAIGLAVARHRAVLGIPAACVVAGVALAAPGAATIVAGIALLVALLIAFAVKSPELAGADDATPGWGLWW